MNTKLTLQNIFIFALFALFFFLIVCMMKPFATVLLWTALLYVLIRPLYLKVVNKLNTTTKFAKLKQNFCAGLFAIGTILVIIIPIATICVLLVQQGIDFLQSAEKYIIENAESIYKSEFIQKTLEFIKSIGIEIPEIVPADIKQSLVGLVQTYSSKLFSLGTTVISKTGTFITSLLFIIFALFFCFLDGPYLGKLIQKAIPINPVHMTIIMQKFADIIKNLFSGYILVALYQGIVSFIIMVCFNIPGSLLFSVVLMFASFIPLFGAAIVWLPIGIVLCITQSVVKGILFLIISAICISFLDNFLRPLFLKDRIHVHPLVIFFAILGGIQVFGMNGLILGPLIVILFFTVLDLLISSNKDEVSPKQTKKSESQKIEE